MRYSFIVTALLGLGAAAAPLGKFTLNTLVANPAMLS